ncbi:MAG: phosphoglucosamine mutase [Candidatus Thermofonsia Clade 1 bacterium]|uniref:Phosphoglucosamine mutase n=1 Tax=Candidatus Thermofonsia Clade 1 bacterium TaxID=2364210 RepID=A0A2M8NZD6_9CHLR|nr:MAG: phosphoglucosamine mutase [Candidatus Thermofonsia Clade 1 bacterium]
MADSEAIHFGTDGIRGVAGAFPLDPRTVTAIGRAIGAWLQARPDQKTERTILLGRDTRPSGPMLAAALSAGLLQENVTVLDAGVTTTPAVAYLTRLYRADLGVVISASHNPSEQNGIKVFGADGFKLPDDSEAQIEARIAALLAAPAPERAPERFGRLRMLSKGFAPQGDSADLPDEAYLRYLIEDVDLSGLSLVLDCANGAAHQLAPEIFRRAGAAVAAINTNSDGYSINVEAGSEHVRRDRSALLAALQAHNADLGLAFDGDADRVIVVTPDGMLIDGDHILGILAVHLKGRGLLAGDTVVATEMSNSGLADYLAAHEIALSRTKVGDRYVMERLRQHDLTLGGEQAGHIIILDDDHGTGDGIYVGLVLAALAAARKRAGEDGLSALAAAIPRYPQVIASAHLRARVDLSAVAGLSEAVEAIHALFEHKGRVNLRFSGTEPNLLRAMVEGSAHNTLQQVVESALRLCHLVAAASGTPQPKIDIVDCVTGAPIQL